MAIKVDRTFWLSLTASIGLSLSAAMPATYAQIIPDATLGLESSTISPEIEGGKSATILIEGGASRVQNLFHSFSEFNVTNGQAVYFANPALVEHIFSRITGSQPSNILGRLGVDGSASLYLLNPNGIFFGPEATLDIEGAFSASTADAIHFAEADDFSAVYPGGASLLTVNLPLGLQTGYISPDSRIENAGNLRLREGETLSFAGGNIQNTGSIRVSGGLVQLVGDRVHLFNSAKIDVSSATGGGQVFIGQNAGRSLEAARVHIDQGAAIDASASDSGRGGQVIVWSTDETNFAGLILARGGEQSGDGGFVEVSGENRLVYTGQVDASANQGNAGLLLIDPTNIEIVDSNADTFDLNRVNQADDPDSGAGGSRIAASAISSSSTNVILSATEDIVFNADIDITNPGIGLTANAGNDIVVNKFIQTSGGGEIRLNANRNISLTNLGSFVWSYGGDIQLTAGDTVSLQGGAQVDTAPFIGDSGSLSVNARQLTLTDGSQFKVAPFFGGQGGELTVDVADRIDLAGIGADLFGSLNSTGFVASDPFLANSQVSGTIDISTRILSIRDGASIGAQRFGAITGGNVTIRDAELVEIVGFSPSSSVEYLSGIFTSPDASRSANGITIDADQLTVSDGGLISSNADGVNAAGSVSLDVDSIFLSGSSAAGSASGLTARSFGMGAPGTVSIRNAQTVRATRGATVDVSSLFPTGADQVGAIAIDTQSLELSDRAMLIANNSGTIIISADDAAVIDDATIFGDGVLGTAAGLISIEAGNLSVLNGGLISTSTFSPQESGNIVLDIDRTLDLDNGFISAASGIGSGQGGDITVEAQDLILSNRSGIDTAAIDRGSAGNLSVMVNSLLLRGQSQISVSGLQAGSTTGNVIIQANSVRIEDNSRIEAIAPSSNGGNITLDLTGLLVLRRGGVISAEAGTEDANIFILPAPGLGNGGNVTIRAPFIVAVPDEDSDITANAFLGNGGNVSIISQGLFGIEFREQRTAQSDITASSELGLSGTVVVDAPDTSALQDGLTELPDGLINSDLLVTTSCIARRDTQSGDLIVNRSSGLPEQPNTASLADFSTGSVQAIPPEEADWQSHQPVVEPDAVYQLADGRLVMSQSCAE